MKRWINSRPAGFTVIELMIVTVIIAILVALAYPSYIDYVRKAKRGEAQQLLLNWAINQEIFRSNNPEYDDGTELEPPCTGEPKCDYDFSVGDTSATAYTLTATARSGNDQENDKARDGSTSCTPMTLNQNGLKTPASCWE